jgi:hypothetical protein
MMKFLLSVMFMSTTALAAVPEGFPRYVVPGHEGEMDALRRMYWLHYEPAGPLIPLWDEWMPNATLWPAVSSEKVHDMRARWATALASRGMNPDGYVHTHQHDGLAHAQGWPFPLWTQAGGVGWHFRGTGISGYDAPLVKPDGWTISHGKGGEIDARGWVVELSEPDAKAQAPAFAIDSRIAPWLRLNWWAQGLDGAKCFVEWTTKDAPAFSEARRAYFAPAHGDAETRTMIEMYRLPGWKGTITGLRIGFANHASAIVTIKSFHTACDTRHTINNSNFIRGVHDYYLWSKDEAFLREQMPRVRAAMRFMQREFDTLNRKCIYTTWPGHEGRSGVRYVDGKKQIVASEGIGSNYWDLLPFGGEDALATIYYFDALRDLAELEEQMPKSADAFDPTSLRKHADEVREYGQKRFWNDRTGRFGTVDLDGHMHDYGWTFLNNEAIYYDFASPAQARSIRDWISGRRVVEGDTSTAGDIYHFRFGPRSSTLRNIDYYFWAWSNPESIPWGNQVQDGGAVLGWSYHDLMAILKVEGSDAAAARLSEIAKWYDETQREGGYRAYYSKDPSRGTMQGANVPGGLGLDKEFFESILPTQVMLYGFLGFAPTADGFRIDPKLPTDWPELTVTRVALHEHGLDIKATRGGEVMISGTGPKDVTLVVSAPKTTKVSATNGLSVKIKN